MIHQDRQPTPDQQHQKKEIEKVAPPNPSGKPMRPAHLPFDELRQRRQLWKAIEHHLHPRNHYRNQNQGEKDNQNRGPYPDANSAVLRIMYGTMCTIERDHRVASYSVCSSASSTLMSI